MIIAADTVVAIEGQILGKPRSPEEALQFLHLLAGKTHEVITGCAIESLNMQESFSVLTHVSMWDCPEPLLASYAASSEPTDKAGAYAIQGQGAFLIKSIEGSWTNVVGLPLAELIHALLQNGAITPASS